MPDLLLLARQYPFQRSITKITYLLRLSGVCGRGQLVLVTASTGGLCPGEMTTLIYGDLGHLFVLSRVRVAQVGRPVWRKSGSVSVIYRTRVVNQCGGPTMRRSQRGQLACYYSTLNDVLPSQIAGRADLKANSRPIVYTLSLTPHTACITEFRLTHRAPLAWGGASARR